MKRDYPLHTATQADDEIARLRQENGDLRLMVAVTLSVINELQEAFKKAASNGRKHEKAEKAAD